MVLVPTPTGSVKQVSRAKSCLGEPTSEELELSIVLRWVPHEKLDVLKHPLSHIAWWVEQIDHRAQRGCG